MGVMVGGGRGWEKGTMAVLTYIKSLWGDRTSLGLSIRESQALVSDKDPFPEE